MVFLMYLWATLYPNRSFHRSIIPSSHQHLKGNLYRASMTGPISPHSRFLDVPPGGSPHASCSTFSLCRSSPITLTIPPGSHHPIVSSFHPSYPLFSPTPRRRYRPYRLISSIPVPIDDIHLPIVPSFHRPFPRSLLHSNPMPFIFSNPTMTLSAISPFFLNSSPDR